MRSATRERCLGPMFMTVMPFASMVKMPKALEELFFFMSDKNLGGVVHNCIPLDEHIVPYVLYRKDDDCAVESILWNGLKGRKIGKCVYYSCCFVLFSACITCRFFLSFLSLFPAVVENESFPLLPPIV